MLIAMAMSTRAAYAQYSIQSIMKTSKTHSLAPLVITACGVYIHENDFFNAVIDAVVDAVIDTVIDALH
jgi:hypothetical protein